MTDFVQWEGFQGRIWKEEVNTRDFIQKKDGLPKWEKKK